MEINNLTTTKTEDDKILEWSSILIKNNHMQVQTTKPLILISNDDGIMSKGVSMLIEFIKPFADIVAVVPDRQRSGSSSSITSESPINYSLVKKEVGVTLYKCSGTPSDCIKLALNCILDRTPDLIIAGINHGNNASVNVHYSGTMAIAIEGALAGIPSIGFSLYTHNKDADFTEAKRYVVNITKMVLKKGLPKLTCLNVNFPKTDKYIGVKVTTQAKGKWTNEWEKIVRENGNEHFWLTGKFVDEESSLRNERADRNVLKEGYVSICPVKVDVTDYSYLQELENICLSENL